MKRSRKRSGVLLGIAAAAVVALSLAFATQQGSSAVGPGPHATSASVDLDGIQVDATRYELRGEAVKATKRSYTLRLTLPVTGDAALVAALQPNRTFGTVTLTIMDAQAMALMTLVLAEAKVVSYDQAFDATTNAFTQEVVFASDSLAVT
jgi:hypothetical protein